MIRTVISVNGYQEHGKTTTINSVIPLIFKHYPTARFVHVDPVKSAIDFVLYDGNVNCVIEIGSIKIGIESEGDVTVQVIDSLKKLVKEDCNIILCCTHPQNNCGAKIFVDRDMHSRHGYRILRMSNYSLPKNQRVNKALIAQLNQHSADQIFDTIRIIIDGVI